MAICPESVEMAVSFLLKGEETMNKIRKIILGTLFLATPALADTSQSNLQSTLVEEKIIREDANTKVIEVNYKGSDALAISDPVGNSPMNAAHDAGPPLTRVLPYGSSCQNEACHRAEMRWGMNTSWQHDRATGLSLGWGN
jgi:hypothetical protein